MDMHVMATIIHLPFVNLEHTQITETVQHVQKGACALILKWVVLLLANMDIFKTPWAPLGAKSVQLDTVAIRIVQPNALRGDILISVIWSVMSAQVAIFVMPRMLRLQFRALLEHIRLALVILYVQNVLLEAVALMAQSKVVLLIIILKLVKLSACLVLPVTNAAVMF